jgi:hypothetical protein
VPLLFQLIDSKFYLMGGEPRDGAWNETQATESRNDGEQFAGVETM